MSRDLQRGLKRSRKAVYQSSSTPISATTQKPFGKIAVRLSRKRNAALMLLDERKALQSRFRPAQQALAVGYMVK
jgi:hypothetical protein